MQAADSLTLAQLAPGVSLGSENSVNQLTTLRYAINGQRPRGNSFMIDGVENNEITIAGPAFTITNPDAVQELVIQTADFSAEYGRSGGAVFNQVTKSGTNQLHGTLTYVYAGSAFKALNHLDRISGLTRAPRAVENIPDFTFGGPVVIPGLYHNHGKTFFFAAAQWDRLFDNATRNGALNSLRLNVPGPVRVPDAAGVALLQSLAPTFPNAALFLRALGSLRGDPNLNPAGINLAVPSPAGACTNSTRAGMVLTTGQVNRAQQQSALDNNHLIRVDHIASDKQTLMFRWLYDSNVTTPSTLTNLPPFDSTFIGTFMTGAFTDTYVVNPRWTNEFRFNYGRIGIEREPVTSDSFALNLPSYSGLGNGMSSFGVFNTLQARFNNNWQYQDTMSLVRGKHTFRFGPDFLRQLARAHTPLPGALVYSSSSGVAAFTNFLDDFGGASGTLSQQFGSFTYHPNHFRQSYFFQDFWKTTANLTLNIGLRYEYFGAPENTFVVAGFTNYDPINFAAPHKVDGYKLNFGPSLGFAWNPKGPKRLSLIMGGEKMVWRGGFQTSYDSLFQSLAVDIDASSPNTLGGRIVSVVSAAAPRGAANFSSLFAGITATPPDKTSAQTNVFLGSFPNPQTHRWSLGFERELPYDLIWDASYVGSVSHHLYQSLDLNPIVDALGNRLHSELQNPLPPSPTAGQIALHAGQGIRTVRAASANSNYEALQLSLGRRFKQTPFGPVQFLGSYTYGHYLDNISDVIGFDSTPSPFQSVPQVLGFSPRVDYGNSDFDRRHVGALAVLWSLPGLKTGVLRQVLGGWAFSSISHWQTGFPFTVVNGTDRNGDGQSGPDRPDISNPAAPLNTRGQLAPSAPPSPGALPGQGWCPTGFSNPDATPPPGLTLACIDPATVHFIEGRGPPNARTVGRNTLRAPGIGNLSVSVAKRFRLTERAALECRVDMFNALNTINLGNFVAARTVNGSGKGSFLDFTQTESFGRSMRMQLRLGW